MDSRRETQEGVRLGVIPENGVVTIRQGITRVWWR